MIGKSLLVLLNELTKPERHLLVNICKKSKDKRHYALYILLRNTTAASFDFEKAVYKSCLQLIKSKKESEKHKTIRRFIDFAVKEIENIKIKNFINYNLSERNYLLGKIFTISNNKQLTEYYFNKASTFNTVWFAAEKKEQQLQALLNNVSVSNNKKSLKALKALVVEKNELTQKIYHSSLSGIYERLSFLAMEDISVVKDKELKELILTENEINQLLKIAVNTVEEFRYRLARLRFLFYNNDFHHVKKAVLKKLMQSTLREDDKKSIQLQIAYLSMLHDFNNGVDACKINFSINSNSYEQEKFYYYLINLLSQYENKITVSLNTKLKFSNTNKDLQIFLELMENFLNRNFTKCIKPVGVMAYSEHFNIMAWSKLIELKLHLIKENYDYCESLIGRYDRFLKQHESKIFTAQSNKICFKILTNFLKNNKRILPPISQYSSLTCLHRAIININ